ncbi:MAG: hydantoinase B/oxoprolinase family protein, partial [Alphaproteobacteria bacterium]|nr:hydantoinase B/oxoprolinase family protein [Alphaproteobacteria bacterium]
RTAYSHIMRDSMDYSTALCDWEGRTIAQGLTNPIHLGSFPDAMRRVVKDHRDTTRPGDIFIFNDPYSSGGMHLPDVFIIKPVFVGDRLQGFAATLGHQCDIGGMAPGGMAVFATEIFQEGLRIPLAKLYDAGQPNRTMFDILEHNVRVPVQVMGDIRAQLAACRAGERGLTQLIGKYGVDTYRRYVVELHDYAERLIRAEIQALPDGVFEFEDFLDGLGEAPEPIRFKCTITIAGDSIAIDWTGTSPQVKGAVNGPMPTTNSMAYLAVRCAVRAPIPNCEGYMRAITVSAPEGTVVNPRLPAACGARGIIAYRMLDAMFGALAQAAPDRVPAASEGGPSSIQFAGRNDGKPFVFGGGLLGCWGGRRDRDGLDGVSNPGANLSNQPIEVIEQDLPIEITSYSLVENSGGPGRMRGGYALSREFRLLGDEALLILRSDRRDVLPYGLGGGEPGTPSWNIVNPGKDQRLLPVCPMAATQLKRGDRFRHVQPGGGGYGDPLEREPEKVLAEVRNEMITADYAADVYGIVIRDDRVDEAATRARRDAMRRSADGKAYLRHFHATIGIDDGERAARKP